MQQRETQCEINSSLQPQSLQTAKSKPEKKDVLQRNHYPLIFVTSDRKQTVNTVVAGRFPVWDGRIPYCRNTTISTVLFFWVSWSCRATRGCCSVVHLGPLIKNPSGVILFTNSAIDFWAEEDRIPLNWSWRWMNCIRCCVDLASLASAMLRTERILAWTLWRPHICDWLIKVAAITADRSSSAADEALSFL